MPEEPPVHLGPFIMRAATWPIETLDGLHSRQLANDVDRWLDSEQGVREAGARLSDVLHEVVPRIPDARGRGRALALRRHVYASADPIPARLLDPVIDSAAIPDDVKAAVRDHAAERLGLAAGRTRLQCQFESALAAEREELFRIAREPGFLNALYLSSPAAFASWERARNDAGGGRIGQLTMTLFGYVTRAVGRTTPNGLWAGVALESPEEDPADTSGPDLPSVRVTRQPGLLRFAPALEPFATALRAIGARDPWRRSLRLQLNPTLRPAGSDAWRFEVRTVDGRVSGRQVAHPRLTRLVAALRTAPAWSPDQIRAALTTSLSEVPSAERETWVLQLLEAGVLLPVLALPPIYGDPWEALRIVIEQLPEEEQPVWERVVTRLGDVCRALDGDPASLTPEAVQRAADEARACVGELLERYGLPPLSGRDSVLLADLRLPLRFVVSRPLKAKMARAIRAYWHFDRYGLGKIEAAIGRWRTFGRLLGAGELMLAEVLERWRHGKAVEPLSGEQSLTGVDESSLRARADVALDRWYAELEPTHARATHRLNVPPPDRDADPLPPGAALLRLGGTDRAPVLRLGGVAPDPCLFYARFHRLLDHGETGSGPFAQWYREGLRRTETAFPGLEFVDLGVRISANLNAAARPRMARRWVDPLGIEAELPGDSRLRVAPDGRPVWILPSADAMLVPLVHSAAALENVDPASRLLAEMSQLVGRPGLMRPLPMLGAERTEWRHLPRLVLDDDTVVSPERWLPPASVGAELARARGLARFIAWRRFARSVGLPAVVYAKCPPEGTETFIPTDSVLAVERLGRALAVSGPDLQLQEVFPLPDGWWLRDGAGRRYLAELGLAWHGDDEFWREYWRAGLGGRQATVAS